MKAGDEIKCALCGKVVLIAKVDIVPHSDLKSEKLLHPDGSPVEPGDLQVCPHCWAFFRSISTSTKKTIF